MTNAENVSEMMKSKMIGHGRGTIHFRSAAAVLLR